ncbi:SusD/RagB family nutrient-binding outer membrane lipoprotein [Pedobacter alpinus]|uniref:SusD/RagB family nutrient-binding outer membrane lipoprotein n=1 Tax=Pedobacter alpinus TaxID=1590643 RepID=A0ABW5TTQ8_9SPHI
MKKITNKITAILLSSLLFTVSCKEGFEEINTDPISTPNALPQQLLAPALVGTLTPNMIRNRNFNNELMQITVNQSDGDATVFRYEYRNNISDYTWNNWYIQLTNFKDLYNIANQPITLNNSYKGIALICEAWIYSLLTDTYGDIPYSESNQGANKVFEPKFDNQRDVYLGIFAKLEEANTLLTTNTAIVASSDPVFNGNVARWRRFGNSLYLRLLLRVSGKAEIANEAIAKIKDIVDTNASTYPKMANNDDSAILRWTGFGPYTSPYQTGVRVQDFRDPAIANFFIDNLRDWADPRIDISTYGTGGVNRWGISQGANGFAGIPSGYVPGTGATKQSGFYSSDQRTVSLQTDPLTGIMMTYAEYQFILAEAATKGWIDGSAESFYKTGVLFSITQWLPNWPNATSSGVAPSPAISINSQAFLDYLTTAELNWDDSLPIDAPFGSDSKMEKIHIQKYYSMFLADMQQWFEYRRTGHPFIERGPGLRNGGVMPARMTYPVYVQSANPTNYKNAIANQGADVISTQVWWQKP